MNSPAEIRAILDNLQEHSPAWTEKLRSELASMWDKIEECERLRTRLAEAEKIIQDAARVELIDAESSGDKIVFRFTMKGEQLFNPPMFVRAAQAFIGQAEQGGADA